MLQRLELENFRSYEKIGVDCGSDLVLVVGDNASGKTNLIEAVYYLLALRSFRSPDNLLARTGSDYFRVSGQLDGSSAEVIVATVPTVRRRYRAEGQPKTRQNWPLPPVVLFVPSDLNLFFLGPAERREFLNRVLVQTKPGYREDLAELGRILKQKSALFQAIVERRAGGSELSVFNEQLASVAVRLTAARQEFVGYLQQEFPGCYRDLMGSLAKQYRFEYKHMRETREPELLEYLESRQAAEISAQANLIGPHRDDLSLLFGDISNVHASSQGELRAQVLALKFLETRYVEQKTGRPPVLLLDDVFSELDETRRVSLTTDLRGHQIFITTTEIHHLPKNLGECRVLTVENGGVKEG